MGGSSPGTLYLEGTTVATASLYDPAANAWMADEPFRRAAGAEVGGVRLWTGSRLLIWGGRGTVER